MKRLAVIAALLVAPGLATAEDSTGRASIERFQLSNICRPVDLLVENLGNESAEIGLTKERIETLVRSRLQAARIYPPDRDAGYLLPFIYVKVSVGRTVFGVDFSFLKFFKDLVTNETGHAATWERGGTGTHGRDAGYILQFISKYTDEFIDEYLRVNGEDC